MFQLLIISILRVVNYFFLHLLLVVLLSSCTTPYSHSSLIIIDTQSLYLDRQFVGFSEINIESANEVFGIDVEMRKVVEQELLPIKNYKKRATQLLQHIFSNNNINLTYQDNANLTAIQTYHSQVANCMSLTIMAYALAKEAGLEVKFQQLEVPEYWIRNGNYNQLAGHVNLVITRPEKRSRFKYFSNEILEIDFDPLITKKLFPRKIINQPRVLAMFYNNKGAQFLIQKNYLEAYAYLREATLVDVDYSSSWSNLGVLYNLNGNEEAASRVFRYAFTLDSNNLTALTNLSLLLEKQGVIEEVKIINRKLSAKRSRNPYYHALLANDAYRQGELQKSLQYYRKAIRLKSDAHEFYYGLAIVYNKLDNWPAAETAMKKALYYNHGDDTEKKYMSFLDSIRTQKKVL